MREVVEVHQVHLSGLLLVVLDMEDADSEKRMHARLKVMRHDEAERQR